MRMSDEDQTGLQQAAGEDYSIEEVDPAGNVTLLIEGPSVARFLVSSKILSIASQVFAGLFHSGFSESMQMENTTCPTISLHEDNPEAMRVIFRALHYKDPEQGILIDAGMLATLAIHCNKYDCAKALQPWVFKWFSGLQNSTTSEEDFGYLLLAAHLFRSAEQFSRLFIKAQTGLSLAFFARWEKMDTMDLLPDGVQRELADRIEKLLDRIHIELQSVEGRLRDNQAGYLMQGLLCVLCGRTHPDTARKCHHCKNNNLIDKYCTSDSRIAEYFAALRKSRLWPSLEAFQNSSADEIASFISQIRRALRHSCHTISCPLESELDRLTKSANEIIGEVRGIDLNPLI
ncbi:hypothetical protein P170DRAFT_512599 [Aspergillus steynii IBT 23096]|uniref:BTB domain-containing protein n=1 Tax=Aspergillus steynii IBT 23096 TaxID=1392250 RepID=A0A2I2FZD3_9EURO|nr:uncharacterized protein P170DRAFT_512599 [Aspergillus steynii IBT 23096]PLB45999.1 hypothetical protein P170DRAFT_512599 [Aspergillus steynii IBT 23096]